MPRRSGPAWTGAGRWARRRWTVTDRNRHRKRKSKSPGTFARASREDTAARIAPAAIIMANNPA